MTLIASYVLHGHPVIIGDLLLTRGVSDIESTTQIPSVRDINKELHRKREVSVVGLRQKVNLIGGNFCVAWAGSYIHARSIIQHFYDSTGGRDISEDHYNDILNSVPLEDLRNVEMLTYHYDAERERFSRRNLNLPHFELGKAVDIQVGGSGTSEFIQQFEQVQSLEPVGEANALAKAVAQTQVLCNSFWGLETLHGGGVGDGWGGGFETVYFNNGRFQKLSNILYLYWEAQQLEDGDIDLCFRPRLMKTDYQDKNLLIRLSDSDEEEISESIFVVSPMFETSVKQEVTIPDYSYEWLNSFVRLELIDGTFEYLSTVHRYGGAFRPLVVRSTNRAYEIVFDEGYSKQIFKAVKNKLAEM